jgi:hypothetical protein
MTAQVDIDQCVNSCSPDFNRLLRMSLGLTILTFGSVTIEGSEGIDHGGHYSVGSDRSVESYSYLMMEKGSTTVELRKREVIEVL